MPTIRSTQRRSSCSAKCACCIRGIRRSLANSSGIFLGAAAHCDLVRPGVALYGVNPTPGKPNPMRPVVELKGRILQVRASRAATRVGYSATWTAKRADPHRDRRPSAMPTASCAPPARGRKPGGQAIVAGKRCPLVGRVSMDLIAIDVTDLPEAPSHAATSSR